MPDVSPAPKKDGSAETNGAVLSVENLVTRFDVPDGEVCAVNNVNFEVGEGETVGIVGESGSGKSQVFMSVMGLLASNGKADGRVRYRGEDILGLPAQKLNRIRGAKMSMIFQDPMTSLEPVSAHFPPAQRSADAAQGDERDRRDEALGGDARSGAHSRGSPAHLHVSA